MAYSNPRAGFLTDDFLLQSKYAKILYHEFAKEQPIIDYHNHLSPAQISSNHKFENLSQIWLAGDHYKWRAMRTLGIDEHYITGGASDEEKFTQWAKAVPFTLRNPLYHWSQLELKRYFGIDELLCEANAAEIYQTCNAQLSQESFSTQGLLAQMKVTTVCTTDDPIDSLEHHMDFHKKSNANLEMYPAFRPDKSFAVENPPAYVTYLGKLGEASGITIRDFDTLISALKNRVDYFHQRGCRVADHGLEQLYFFSTDPYAMDQLIKDLIAGKTLTTEMVEYFKFKVLTELSKMYHSKGWVQQYHLGALRNTNHRMLSTLGPDTGFDSIGDFDQAMALSKFLNHLDSTDQLTKTILYNLNPRDNEVMATMVGNFNDGSTKGKIQFGSGWWYLDQKDGMEKQINTLSNMGMISCFIGMLTDSRSFLSFPRHEYFRRILCNLFGKDVENGELPWDEKWLGDIISGICYGNANEYFDFSPKNYNY
ncbi:glucuronate isomerase [Algoriphagus halophytocola]|uniref:Uronate isomerase n=1 Tax=Algoriphagus halophytocola TaxID=2991499 RepID=A0ABY6MLF5_9BACT|nr:MULTISPECIES: glucuronate isomerase [unclassified Algoriphagus]UZD23111.1 glucuronate isomerase [Algoriphagus sp. TR-M5]WBL44403.1 glucuronate isomerase [Algoriphagus sp. TR-M9]